jgi:hypothetical protein
VIISPVDSEGAAGLANNKAKNAIRSFGDVSLTNLLKRVKEYFSRSASDGEGNG